MFKWLEVPGPIQSAYLFVEPVDAASHSGPTFHLAASATLKESHERTVSVRSRLNLPPESTKLLGQSEGWNIFHPCGGQISDEAVVIKRANATTAIRKMLILISCNGIGVFNKHKQEDEYTTMFKKKSVKFFNIQSIINNTPLCEIYRST